VSARCEKAAEEDAINLKLEKKRIIESRNEGNESESCSRMINEQKIG
jgi:hypothetical protein